VPAVTNRLKRGVAFLSWWETRETRKVCPMAEDLLTRIQRELQERIEELHCAVQERDRLQAELRALDVAPKPLPVSRNIDPEPSLEPASPSPPEPLLDPEPPSDPEPPLRPALAAVPDVDPEPAAAVLRFPTKREPARAPTAPPAADRPIPAPARSVRRHAVSPKVARLMLAPRRPALERPGVARVGARAGRVDVSSQELVDEVDADAELFGQSL
jgi:hypothetical protein